MSASIIELFFELGEKYRFIRYSDNIWHGEHWGKKIISESYNYKLNDVIALSKMANGIRVR